MLTPFAFAYWLIGNDFTSCKRMIVLGVQKGDFEVLIYWWWKSKLAVMFRKLLSLRYQIIRELALWRSLPWKVSLFTVTFRSVFTVFTHAQAYFLLKYLREVNSYKKTRCARFFDSLFLWYLKVVEHLWFPCIVLWQIELKELL